MTTFLKIMEGDKCIFLSDDEGLNGHTTRFWSYTCIGYKEKEQVIHMAKMYYDEAVRGKDRDIVVSGEYEEAFLEEIKKPPMKAFVVSKRKVKETDYRVYAYDSQGALKQARDGYSDEISRHDRFVRLVDESEWKVREE